MDRLRVPGCHIETPKLSEPKSWSSNRTATEAGGYLQGLSLLHNPCSSELIDSYVTTETIGSLCAFLNTLKHVSKAHTVLLFHRPTEQNGKK